MERCTTAATSFNTCIYWIDPDATAIAALYIGSILILLAAPPAGKMREVLTEEKKLYQLSCNFSVYIGAGQKGS